MFLVTDITSFMDSFINLMYSGTVDCIGILDGITFHGISLLDFSLGILLIGCILPIIINFASSGVSSSRGFASRRARSAKKGSG